MGLTVKCLDCPFRKVNILPDTIIIDSKDEWRESYLRSFKQLTGGYPEDLYTKDCHECRYTNFTFDWKQDYKISFHIKDNNMMKEVPKINYDKCKKLILG